MSTYTTPTLDQDKVAGALLGVHTGDALGAGVEFKSAVTIARRYPDGLRTIVGGGSFNWHPGDATDDTDLTKAVLDAYIRGRGDVVKDAADNMLAWMRRGPKDIGGATRTGLAAYARTGNPHRAGAGDYALGNGSLMRCLPTALCVDQMRDRVYDAKAISAITHDARIAQWACVAYVEIIRALVEGETPEVSAQSAMDALATADRSKKDRQAVHAVRKTLERGWDTDLAVLRAEWLDEITTARENTPQEFGKYTSKDKYRSAFGDVEGGAEGYWRYTTPLPEGPGGGYVLKGLRLAAAALNDKRDFVEPLVDVVMLGDDTDTNGAIVGGVLGAKHGATAIPTEWLDTLEYGSYFRHQASKIV